MADAKYKIGANSATQIIDPAGAGATVGDGSGVASSEVANQTNLELLADLELIIGSTTAGAGEPVYIYDVGSLNGTDWETGHDASVQPRKQPIATIAVFSTNDERHKIDRIPLSPNKTKFVVWNSAGSSLNAVELLITTYLYQSVTS